MFVFAWEKEKAQSRLKPPHVVPLPSQVIMETEEDIYDLLIVGAGIACDAAGRGLKVALCEQDDLGSATSSASSKLIHGGLRYLEHYEFRLVRESLRERDVLLSKAPHLVGRREFVLPHYNSRRPA